MATANAGGLTPEMLSLLGEPSQPGTRFRTRSYIRGEFTASFVADVNAGRLVRILEWDAPKGVV